MQTKQQAYKWIHKRRSYAGSWIPKVDAICSKLYTRLSHTYEYFFMSANTAHAIIYKKKMAWWLSIRWPGIMHNMINSAVRMKGKRKPEVEKWMTESRRANTARNGSGEQHHTEPENRNRRNEKIGVKKWTTRKLETKTETRRTGNTDNQTPALLSTNSK